MGPDVNEIIAWIVGTLGITVVAIACASVLILVITVAAIAPFVLIIRSSIRRSRDVRQRTAAGIPATATIVSAESFASRHSSRLNVQLTLDVQPPTGTVYRATTGWAVDYIAASQLQPGQTVAVRIDANNPSLIYPGVAWAEYTNARVIRLR